MNNPLNLISYVVQGSRTHRLYWGLPRWIGDKVTYPDAMALKITEKLYTSAVFCVQKTDKAYFMGQFLRFTMQKIQARNIHTGAHHLSEHRFAR
jgi:hypothetical protein